MILFLSGPYALLSQSHNFHHQASFCNFKIMSFHNTEFSLHESRKNTHAPAVKMQRILFRNKACSGVNTHEGYC